MSSGRIAVIGLGAMGGTIAARLVDRGHAVSVFNRTPARTASWHGRDGVEVARSPGEAAAGAALVLTCVRDDKALREVTMGDDGALGRMRRGSLLVDHTTASADVARELYADAESRGVRFLDAPIAGGVASARGGVLTLMVGGDSGALESVKPLLGVYAKEIRFMGPAGSGQLAKMTVQICAAGIMQSLAEGLRFAQGAGLADEAVLAVLDHGPASSWQLETRGRSMLARDYGGAGTIGLLQKDLKYCLEEARRLQIRLPVAALVSGCFDTLCDEGHGDWDAAGLIALLEATAARGS